jgi:very-short-patch-repair endonuclease
MAGHHVHTQTEIGAHWAGMVLTTTPTPLIVEYDGGWVHKQPATIKNEEVQRLDWAEVGWRIVRLRDRGLPVHRYFDLSLRNGANHIADVALR